MLFISVSFAKVDEVVDKFYSSLESFLEENFENTDFSIKKIETIKPEIGIQTFKIFSEDSSDLSFFQGSLFLHDSDRETFNFGLGQRYLSNDESILFGLNAFYDYEFDYEHQRFSIGAEIKSSILDLNYNQYFAQSSSKKGKNGKDEEAIDGYDVELNIIKFVEHLDEFHSSSVSTHKQNGHRFIVNEDFRNKIYKLLWD